VKTLSISELFNKSKREQTTQHTVQISVYKTRFKEECGPKRSDMQKHTCMISKLNHLGGYRYLTETRLCYLRKNLRNLNGLNVFIVDLDCTKPRIHRGKAKCRKGQDEVLR
jgi:hypothetical protein